MNVHGGSTLAPRLSLGEGEVGFPKAEDDVFASPWHQDIKIAVSMVGSSTLWVFR
jgi:uncharacterized protein (UPF0548 family)